MEFKFASSADLYAEFAETIIVGSVLVFGGALAAWLTSLRNPKPLPLGAVVVVAGIFSLLIAIASYYSTIDAFTAMSIDKQNITLQFPSPHVNSILVPKTEVTNILFGLPGKHISREVRCYMKLELQSGKSYRSAVFLTQLDLCKSMRASIVSALGRP